MVIITTATTKRKIGEQACLLAQKTAGIPCDFIISVDVDKEGGTKTANLAWREAIKQKPDYLCYINDDVKAKQRNWLKRMIEALDSNPKYGIAAPGGRCGTEPLCSAKPGMKKGVQEVGMLSFFCMVMKRAVYEKLGLLDESFIHFGCDSDYSRRALNAGFKLIWVRDVYIEHEFKPLAQRPARVAKWKEHDQPLYWKKWGR